MNGLVIDESSSFTWSDGLREGFVLDGDFVESGEEIEKPVTVYYPRDIILKDLEELAKLERPLKHFQDGIAYFLSLLTTEAQRFDSDGWKAIYSECIKGLIGQREWKAIPKLLESNGIIEIDNTYFYGKRSRADGTKSKRYRLTSKRRQSVFETTSRTITKPLTVKKIREYRVAQAKLWNPEMCEGEVVRYLAENLKKITVDEKCANHAVKRMVKKYKKQSEAKQSRGQTTHHTPKSYAKLLRKKYRSIGKGRWKVDTFGWRLHTELTGLPKGLRNYLTAEGEPMTAVDIKSCQPAILAVVMRQIHERVTNTDKGTSNKNKQVTGDVSKNLPFLCRYLADRMNDDLRGFFASDWQTESTIRYFDACAQGVVYQGLTKHWRSVEEAKETLISEVYFSDTERIERILASQKRSKDLEDVSGGKRPYGPDNKAPYGRGWELFKGAYPEVAAFIRLAKRPGAFGDGFDRWFGDAEMTRRPYRQVAMLLQRMESVFMRCHVLPLFIQRTERAFAATIHDALVVKVCDVQVAMDCFDEAMRQINPDWGVRVKDERKQWTKSLRGGDRRRTKVTKVAA